MNEERAKLYKKIAAVTAAIKRVPKSGHNSYFNYEYALEGDVTDALRGILAEHGLAVLPPTVLTWERGDPDAKGNCLTRVQYQFGLGDCETGETFESAWWAEALDNADKAFNKAGTSALKYWLLKSFLISTGDDASDDPDHGPTEPTGNEARRPSASPQRVTNASGPQCPVHHKGREKDGRWFCPTKLPDGTWCKWSPEPAAPSAEDIARARTNTLPRGPRTTVLAPEPDLTADDLPFDPPGSPFDNVPAVDEDARLAEAIQHVGECPVEHLDGLRAELRRETWTREQATAIGIAFQARAQEATA